MRLLIAKADLWTKLNKSEQSSGQSISREACEMKEEDKIREQGNFHVERDRHFIVDCLSNLLLFCTAVDVLGISAACLCANFSLTHLVHLGMRLLEEPSHSNHIIPSLLGKTKKVCCGSHHLTGQMQEESFFFCHCPHSLEHLTPKGGAGTALLAF